MAALEIAPNIDGVDDVYEQLLSLHDGRTLEDSLRIAARLNLILINHIGDRTVIEQALRHAAATSAAEGADAPASEGERR